MLITLAAPTPVAAAIEAAVIPEAIVGTVHGLPGPAKPGAKRPGATRGNGVMEALIRVVTGASERNHRVTRLYPRSPYQGEHDGDHRDRCAERSTSRRTLR